MEGYWLGRREVGMRLANGLSESARQQENGRREREDQLFRHRGISPSVTRGGYLNIQYIFEVFCYWFILEISVSFKQNILENDSIITHGEILQAQRSSVAVLSHIPKIIHNAIYT